MRTMAKQGKRCACPLFFSSSFQVVVPAARQDRARPSGDSRRLFPFASLFVRNIFLGGPCAEKNVKKREKRHKRQRGRDEGASQRWRRRCRAGGAAASSRVAAVTKENVERAGGLCSRSRRSKEAGFCRGVGAASPRRRLRVGAPGCCRCSRCCCGWAGTICTNKGTPRARVASDGRARPGGGGRCCCWVMRWPSCAHGTCRHGGCCCCCCRPERTCRGGGGGRCWGGSCGRRRGGPR